jgi:hypothetical protein
MGKTVLVGPGLVPSGLDPGPVSVSGSPADAPEAMQGFPASILE